MNHWTVGGTKALYDFNKRGRDRIKELSEVANYNLPYLRYIATDQSVR